MTWWGLLWITNSVIVKSLKSPWLSIFYTTISQKSNFPMMCHGHQNSVHWLWSSIPWWESNTSKHNGYSINHNKIKWSAIGRFLSSLWPFSSYIYILYIYNLVGGFNHLEKYESQWEGLSHILWKIKNVPNHQLDNAYLARNCKCVSSPQLVQ